MVRNVSRLLMRGSIVSLAVTLASPAFAQEAPAPGSTPVTTEPDAGSDIVVTADRAGLLEKRPSNTAFGLDKPIIETPRAISVASDTTLERYGINSITDLIAVSPGAGTASWYGIPGSVNLRGSMADNYFRGFQRLPNWGTYATPLGGAAEVQIVRGPPSAVYGPGRVGGFVNFLPKTSRIEGGYIDAFSGEAKVTLGSYEKKNASLEVSAPVTLGGVKGGISAYGEIEDSHSYYYGVRPRYQLLQLAADFDFGDGVTFSAGGMYYHSKGYVQTLVNRLTQALVDDGTYITGRDTSLVDLDGNGRLTPNESQGTSFNNATGVTDARSTLDVGVGTTTISNRNITYSGNDFSDTTTQTYYAELGKTFDAGGGVKLQYFYDQLQNDRVFSYGFPASYNSHVQEFRLTYTQPFNPAEWLEVNAVGGVSYRFFKGSKRETYYSAFSALNRRDISFGATPTDILDDPFSPEAAGTTGLTWETAVSSSWTDAGAFGVTDITLFDKLNVLLAGRYDDFGVKSRDDGTIVYTVARGGTYEGNDSDFSWSGSVSYKSEIGLIPYYTHAVANGLELNQAGDIQPGQIFSHNYRSSSLLDEIGLKFSFLDGRLVGSIAGYKQRRTRNDPQINVQIGTRSKGLEGEFRFVVNRNFSLTASANVQETWDSGNTNNTSVPPQYVGMNPADTYGANYRVSYVSMYPNAQYEYTLIPDTTASLFGTFTSDEQDWGIVGATLGVVYTGPTQTLLLKPIYFHDHTVANLSAFVTRGRYTLSGNVTNLLNDRYYTPATDAFANLSAIPGLGREWRVSLAVKF
jgi:iron complex outermembrane receptor protein